MPTSSRLSRQLLLASILCLTFTVQLTSLAAAQKQATHDMGTASAAYPRYRTHPDFYNSRLCGSRKWRLHSHAIGIKLSADIESPVEWIAPSGKV